MDQADDHALAFLPSSLLGSGYRFVAPTPESSRLINARPDNAVARDLAGALGLEAAVSARVAGAGARLARLNRARTTPCLPDEEGTADTGAEAAERDFLHAAHLDVAASAADAPSDGRRFLAWFEGLASTGPGQDDVSHS